MHHKLPRSQFKMARAAMLSHPEAGGSGTDFLIGWALFIGGFFTSGLLWVVWIIWFFYAAFIRSDNRENTAKIAKLQKQQLDAMQVNANRIAKLEEELKIAKLEAELKATKDDEDA